jgi:hypothetical protein
MAGTGEDAILIVEPAKSSTIRTTGSPNSGLSAGLFDTLRSPLAFERAVDAPMAEETVARD